MICKLEFSKLFQKVQCSRISDPYQRKLLQYWCSVMRYKSMKPYLNLEVESHLSLLSFTFPCNSTQLLARVAPLNRSYEFLGSLRLSIRYSNDKPSCLRT